MRNLDREEVAADLVSKMETIVVEHPQMVEAEARIDSMILHARRNPERDKQCMPLIAPSGCGKSTILKNKVNKLNSRKGVPEGHIPALYVTLKPTVGRKSLSQDILYELERVSGRATHPDQGNENVLLERTRNYLKEIAHCELLIVDEFHHVLNSETDKTKELVGEKLKWLLVTGPCPIVVAGTEKAEAPFRANTQLLRRAVPGIALSPLDKSCKTDRDWFYKFFGRYLKSMEELGIAANAPSFVHGPTLSYLLDASGGVVGIGCKILAYAIREMALAGRCDLLEDDFSNACDFLVLGASVRSNPFKSGSRGMKIAAAP